MNYYESHNGERRVARLPRVKGKYSMITGGAGFIGSNLADRLLSAGKPVLVFDNLSRPGVEQNLKWLRETHPGGLSIEIADVRDRAAVSEAVKYAERIYHLAAQVAVTTSLSEPVRDFEVNVLGTLNILESLRSCKNPPSLVFTSTNKVYGNLEEIALRRDGTRYEPDGETVLKNGINEKYPLEFRSPYGCSKGAADQYVLDYARSYGLPATVLRMSCIYGPHQMGTEDQGWIAHFLISTLSKQPLTIYGDGMQVRDVLYVDDLVDALLLAQNKIGKLAGSAFNVGGGSSHTISLKELLSLIERMHGNIPLLRYEGWRSGDQKYYVSDTGRFGELTDWKPNVSVRDGIEKLYRWLIGTGRFVKSTAGKVSFS